MSEIEHPARPGDEPPLAHDGRAPESEPEAVAAPPAAPPEAQSHAMPAPSAPESPTPRTAPPPPPVRTASAPASDTEPAAPAPRMTPQDAAPAPGPPATATHTAGIEPPEVPFEVPRARLAAQSRRDFLLFGAAVVATATGAWWLLPGPTRARLLPGAAGHRLDTLAARVGLTPARRERVLDRALTFDDDVAEALYAHDRRVRTYRRSQVTPLRNNYNGLTPAAEYLPGWTLTLSGLASGRTERLTIADIARLPHREQVTRLVCVEGWSAIAWWGGPAFADLLAAWPPAPGMRWAALRSDVNLDVRGRPDPYYVSIDLATARHPQTLLATHHDGSALTLAHGAPLRLVAPMKLGLKNIKAITAIVYSAAEPPDYWNERGYSKYDGL
jgi:DMSO/TMAO reductase YedYZ molybdopterin-dependent catalytic subunit